MKLINTNKIYYDNDFEKWYFEDDEDFENAQVVDDNYIKENQELKQQLAEKDREINNLKELRKLEIEDKKELRENRLQEIIKLEKKLAEKDKEIEELKTFNGKNIYDTICHALNMQEKQIRKQVCNEIRKEFENRYKGKNWNDNIIIGKVCNTINDVLDQIKGEEQ